MHHVAAGRRMLARRSFSFALVAFGLLAASPAWAAAAEGPSLFGIPLDFILFGITLICVGIFHHHTLAVALTGLPVTFS